MNEREERAELLAALHAAGAASEEDERELAALIEADPSLQRVVNDFEDSIAVLASGFDPLETSPKTLGKIKKQIAEEKSGSVVARLKSWFSKS